MSDIERTSLDAHVSICELRYQALERRLDAMELKMESLEKLLSEIRDSLAQQPHNHSQKWNQVQWWLIGVLAAALGWSLTHLLPLL